MHDCGVRGRGQLFITTATAIYSLGHGLHTLTTVPRVDSAFHPPWDGKMSISFRVDVDDGSLSEAHLQTKSVGLV